MIKLLQRHNTKHDQIVAEKWLKYITVDKSKISKDCLMMLTTRTFTLL